MIPLKITDIIKVCNAKSIGADDSAIITGITADSRKVTADCMFAAMPGERTDGHKYIRDAAKDGAAAILCERKPEEDMDIAVLVVPSTLEALQKIAAYIREISGIPVVGIGGSVGKTSTKECIASVLSQKFNVLKTEGNFNNELGLPLTLFNMQTFHEAAVLEMGISDFGEMRLLASIAKPDICVLTNIGDCHLENLNDRNGVLQAKSEMFDYIGPQGHILLNGDDEHLSMIKAINGIRPVFFGLEPSNEIRAENIKSAGIFGSYCDIRTSGWQINVLVPKPGIHMIMNSLAAAAVGNLMGLAPEEIKKGIENQISIPGRFHITDTGRITVIDDCYNANPVSMKASLKALSEAEGRKVAILGDMGELGENEAGFHEDVGFAADQMGIDVLCCTGTLMKNTANAALKDRNLEVHYFENKKQLIENINGIIKEKDVVLVKASHFMGFEEITKVLIES